MSSLKEVMASARWFYKMTEKDFVGFLGRCVHLLAVSTQVFSM